MSAERKENAPRTAILGVVMLLFAILACAGTGGAARSDTNSAVAASGGTLDQVMDFTFDFNTGDYSFTGAKNAQFYVVRVYAVENGEESVSALAQSDRIDVNAENSYAGRLDTALTAGDYNAYVLAVASGYSPSTTSVSGASTLLAKPSVTAVWDGEDDAPAVKLTIRAGDAIAQSCSVTVAKDGAKPASDASVELAAEVSTESASDASADTSAEAASG